ncbi:HNH endonuclease signature motif containing protein [Pseudoroseomonas sp. WGS1072]|uniref:HNH endonuclease signature motif containing protein n=1 Tax=Roseomonas sp. WGS1072 TaxID=3366816 RepID=UPI003BF34A37
MMNICASAPAGAFCVSEVRMPTRPALHRPSHHDPQAVRRAQLQALDRQRGSASARGYDTAWRRLRLTVLAEEPLCRFCRERGLVTAATEIDHITPIAARPELRLARANLRALCRPCHAALTASGLQRRGASP